MRTGTLTDQLKAVNADLLALYEAPKGENGALSDEQKTTEATLNTEKANIQNALDVQNKKNALDLENKNLETPVKNFAQPKDESGLKVFKNFAEQLIAVKNASQGIRDERLDMLNKEFKNASGANEGVGADGGFAVQTDFAGDILTSAAKAGNILSRVDQFDISAGSNGVKWNEILETDIGTTVFGGINMYWAAEAATATATKPKLAERELKLEKLLGFYYSTYELDADSTFSSNLATKGFTLAAQRALEAAIIGGNGIGKPLGIINSGSLVSVAKESNQTADTVVWKNISKMYNRAIGMDDMSRYVWLVNPDVAEQLDFLDMPIGTGGVPVYLPAAMQGAVPTLKGLPVIPTDQCAALGDKGDIMLVDLNAYMLIMKGGMQADMSMHVAFLTAENCFRFIFRANGMPKKNTTTLLKNSANARSSFITLDARA